MIMSDIEHRRGRAFEPDEQEKPNSGRRNASGLSSSLIDPSGERHDGCALKQSNRLAGSVRCCFAQYQAAL